MNSPDQKRWLDHLARLYGVQTSYRDMNNIRQEISPETLLTVLRSLGAPLANLDEVSSACRERRQALWQRFLEPVTIVWDGQVPRITVRLPAKLADATLQGRLILEDGGQKNWVWLGAGRPVLKAAEIEGIRYVVKRLPIGDSLPFGYHRFVLDIAGQLEETFIISAPSMAYTPTAGTEGRTWGAFLPLYALATQRSWGSGDYSDLTTLVEWVAGLGGRAVATLPLLATFLNDIFEPSPYAPASRLLWNEFYLDITAIPELNECLVAQALLSSFRKELQDLRSLPLVDYRRQMTVKRRILDLLSRFFFSNVPHRRAEFEQFLKVHPVVEDYARFRATGEKRHEPWQLWPDSLRQGHLTEGDYDEEARQYHLYIQWLCSQQVQAVSQTAQDKGVSLYLDLPLGVHPDGYDVWRHQDIFVRDVSAGAPPDTFFIKGQNWGFPPLHPEKMREQHYQYFISYLRHHCQHTGVLRIDHVMGLHRLFWIARGLDAQQGVYVRYHADELYAIFCLESYRNKVVLVGEDLGTVPPAVRPAMARHGFDRMHIATFELTGNPAAAIHSPPPNTVASLNTHDMSPFAGFWKGLDIKQRVELGLLDPKVARRDQRSRQVVKKALTAFLQQKGLMDKPDTDLNAIIAACLAFLSASEARMVLINLEDLWQEEQPQNVPGTTVECPNWRRKSRYSFEEFCQMPQVTGTLKKVNGFRKGGKTLR
ncbi:MAG: 4-alpha-glucanotransferase [Chloroflexota bacterium]